MFTWTDCSTNCTVYMPAEQYPVWVGIYSGRIHMTHVGTNMGLNYGTVWRTDRPCKQSAWSASVAIIEQTGPSRRRVRMPAAGRRHWLTSFWSRDRWSRANLSEQFHYIPTNRLAWPPTCHGQGQTTDGRRKWKMEKLNAVMFLSRK